jgi:hypothetical protein
VGEPNPKAKPRGADDLAIYLTKVDQALHDLTREDRITVLSTALKLERDAIDRVVVCEACAAEERGLTHGEWQRMYEPREGDSPFEHTCGRQ